MAKRDSRLVNARNPLSYLGNNAYSPPNITDHDRAPTTDDKKNVYIGDLWMDASSTPRDVYMLVNLAAGSATWLLISSAFDGTVVDHAVMVGLGTTSIKSIPVGVEGELLVGVTGADPEFNTVSIGDFGFVRADAGERILTVGSLDDTTATSHAELSIVTGGTSGGDPKVTFSFSGSAQNWGIGIDNSDSDKFKISASTDLGLLDALVIDPATRDVDITQSLTLSSELAGVVQTDAGGLVSSTAGTDGQVLISDTAGVPAWRTLTEGSNISITNGANSITIASTASGAGSPTSAFLAYVPTTYNIGAASSPFYIGEVAALTEDYDVGLDFYVGDGAGDKALFTAPVDGKYLFTFSFAGTGELYFAIETSGGPNISQSNTSFDSNHSSASSFISAVVDMTAADTASFFVSNGTGEIVGVEGSTAGMYRTSISGVLLNTQAVAEEYDTDAGTAVPSSGTLEILGGTNCTTSAVGNTVTIDATGGLASATCSFLAYKDVPDSLLTFSEVLKLGDHDAALNEIYDVGGDLYPGDGAGAPAEFTAPQTGKYILTSSILSASLISWIQTSNRIYHQQSVSPGIGTPYSTHVISVIADMDIGDTATFGYFKDRTAAGDVSGKTGALAFLNGAYQTYISGSLI